MLSIYNLLPEIIYLIYIYIYIEYITYMKYEIMNALTDMIIGWTYLFDRIYVRCSMTCFDLCQGSNYSICWIRIYIYIYNWTQVIHVYLMYFIYLICFVNAFNKMHQLYYECKQYVFHMLYHQLNRLTRSSVLIKL